MRATRLVFLILAWPLLLGGLAMIGLALSIDDMGAMIGLGIGGLSVAGTGVVFLFVARYYKRFLGAPALGDPVPGTARALSVSDSGVTINNINAVFRVDAMITVDGRPPYEGEFDIVVGRTQFGAIQPGAILPVLVERTDPSKIVHDRNRPVISNGTPGATVAARTMSAADVIARGVATQGLLQTAESIGATAGQVVGSLPAHEADDPLVKVVFTYTPTGMAEQRSEVLVRVPDGKGHWLQPGETLPLVYLPDEPTTATIDWSRL